jgi:hypothetical protein
LHQSDNGETSTYDGRERHPPPQPDRFQFLGITCCWRLASASRPDRNALGAASWLHQNGDRASNSVVRRVCLCYCLQRQR